ncbi:cytochrome P450 [Novosphingobium aquimarinum]|uniref:cytochrome P450 n=1 Tax=Novosphingobium aquimarinum TaxID=2682494 RepID=UPI0018DCD104|nr:cytochrome P450 [Novosphingobium aquimarinum]
MNDPFYTAEVPAHVPANLIHDFNIFGYNDGDYFEIIDGLFRQGVPPVFWTRHNGGHWVALGIEAVNEMAAKPNLFSTRRLFVPDNQNSDVMEFPPLDVEPPLHTHYRAVVAPLFGPDRVKTVTDNFRALCRKLAQDVRDRGECEFIEEVASILPVQIFLDIMDLPREDGPHLRAVAHRILDPNAQDGGDRSIPLNEIEDYLRPIIRGRMEAPQNDAISELVNSKVDGRPLTYEEAFKLTRAVLLGGLDTTVGMMSYMTRYLAMNPPARAELRGNSDLIRKAIEEFLRRYPVSVIGRWMTADHDFHGAPVKAGDHVLWPVGAFNFDPVKFPDPMTVDFLRSGNRHATFGVGVHFCVGAFLARAELRIFLEEWLDILPDFTVREGFVSNYRGGFTVILERLDLVVEKETLAAA